MTPLEMIAEWRKGCSNASADHPEQCQECTRALIDSLEAALGGWQQPCNFGGPPPEAKLLSPNPTSYAKLSDYAADPCKWNLPKDNL